jgi:hypothetical protein
MKRRCPFRQVHGCPPVDSLRVHWGPLFPSSHRRGAFAISPHPGVPSFPGLRLLCPFRLFERALAFRWGLPSLLPTRLDIPHEVSRVRHGGLKAAGLGGTFRVAPSTLCGSPVPEERHQVLLSHLLQDRSSIPPRSRRPSGGVELAWLTQKGRCVRGSLPRRARRTSGDSPCHLSAKHHRLDTYLLLMVSLRCMLLTLQRGLERLTPKAHRVPGYLTV